MSIFIFWESLNLKESIWIMVWIMVPLMLITKSENKIQKNLKMWVYLVIITSIFASISNWFNKSMYSFNLNIDLFIVFSLILWTIISLFSYKYFDKKTKKHYSKKGIYGFSILLGIIHFIAFYVFTLAVEWNLAIAYTINSFSILIPIILSVFFYKEEMTFKKAFVIFLSIISMLLFI
jgi:drug/metabolite transporter (DMT)-like permease